MNTDQIGTAGDYATCAASLDSFRISRGDYKSATGWRVEDCTWPALIKLMTGHHGGRKEGSAWCPARFTGGIRSNRSALSVDLAVLDCDRDDTVEDIAAAVRRRNYAAIISSTYSHGVTQTEVKPKLWEDFKRRHVSGDAALYMEEEGYSKNVYVGAKLVIEGEQYIIRHRACSKFRVILPVRNAFLCSEHDLAGDAARYRAGLERLEEELSIVCDHNAFDLARLFFDPRHPAGREPEFRVIPGWKMADPWPGTATPVSRRSTIIPAAEENVEDDLNIRKALPGRTFDLDGLTFDQFSTMVMTIPNDRRFDHRSAWIKIIGAIHSATGGQEDGRKLCHSWSEGWSGGNDAIETDRAWRSIKRGPGAGGSTIGTLYQLALEAGWRRPPGGKESAAPFGDLWFGTKFAEVHRGKLLRVEAAGHWLRWDGVCWLAMNAAELDALAKTAAEAGLDEAHKRLKADPESGRQAYKNALRYADSIDRTRKIPDAAASEPGMSVFSPADFDQDPWILGVRNGAINLKTGKFFRPRPEDRISKQARAEFDEGALCPMFLKLLHDALGSSELVAFFQRALGYTLTGSVNEEVIFFCHGRGANGKSVISNVMAALLGDYTVTVATALLTKNKHENEAERSKAQLPGRRLALANETEIGEVWAAARLKELASREPITARLLHHEPFQFQPTAKFWIRSNHAPGVQDSGDGFWRRLIMIPFNRQIPERDRIPDLDGQIIREELPGVLNFALEGCRAYREQGLDLPWAVRAGMNAYRHDTDLDAQWREEFVVENASTKVKVEDAYRNYQAFYEAQGHKRAPVSRLFKRMMQDAGFEMTKSKSVPTFKGMSLRSGFGDRFSE